MKNEVLTKCLAHSRPSINTGQLIKHCPCRCLEWQSVCSCTYPTHYLSKTGQSPCRYLTLEVLFRLGAGGQSVELRHGGKCGAGGVWATTPGQPGWTRDEAREDTSFRHLAATSSLAQLWSALLLLEHLPLSKWCSESGREENEPIPSVGRASSHLASSSDVLRDEGTELGQCLGKKYSFSTPFPSFCLMQGTETPERSPEVAG